MTDLFVYAIKSIEVQKLWKDIRQHYSTRSESNPVITQVFHDTFDWRLFQKNLTLVREVKDVYLAHVATLEPRSKVLWPKKATPKFWWQFPEGPVKDVLKPLLDVRALLPLAAVQNKHRSLSILNEDEKTVIRIHNNHIHINDETRRGQNVHSLTLQPIRGYNQDLQNFRQFLQERDVVQKEEDLYRKLLNSVGKTPGDYTSKFKLDLAPDLFSVQAMRMILRYLIGVITSNVDGVKADIDTEFLHDFRVASRRVRSALGQIKGVFPGEKSNQFRKDFSILGKTTNILRDLDVYLLKQEQYRALLPEHLVGGLDPFFQDISEARKAELRNVKKFLNSASYRNLVSRWEGFIDSNSVYAVEEAKNAQRPVLELAQRFIFRRYKQIIRDGQNIADDSSDEHLHRLRIDCKKLRYLLEFFSSLFPEKNILTLIGQLKKLQDNLGDFNDLFVQQEHLREYFTQIKKSRPNSLLTAAAIGGLITALSQRQKSVRSEFKRRFEDFSSKKNRVMFTKLFQPRSKGGPQA